MHDCSMHDCSMYPVQLWKARHQMINQVYLIHLVLARQGAGYTGQSGQHRQHFVQLGKARHQMINQVYLIHLVLARQGAGYAGQSGQHRQHFRPHVHLGSVTQLQPSVKISASPSSVFQHCPVVSGRWRRPAYSPAFEHSTVGPHSSVCSPLHSLTSRFHLLFSFSFAEQCFATLGDVE